eukprot:3875179-Rhodomonas_salina.1
MCEDVELKRRLLGFARVECGIGNPSNSQAERDTGTNTCQWSLYPGRMPSYCKKYRLTKFIRVDSKLQVSSVLNLKLEVTVVTVEGGIVPVLARRKKGGTLGRLERGGRCAVLDNVRGGRPGRAGGRSTLD